MDRDDTLSEQGASADRHSASLTATATVESGCRTAGRYKVACYPPLLDAQGRVVTKTDLVPVLREGSRFLAWARRLLGLPNYRMEALVVPVPDLAHPRWVENIPNKIPTVGLNYGQDAKLGGSAQISAWFVGLKGTGSVVAGDTMGSHAGWAEISPYSNATRPAWTKDGVSASGVMTNSASPAQFTINAGATVYGAFLASNSTVGGTTGTLYSAADFSSSRAVLANDTVIVTAAFTDTSST